MDYEDDEENTTPVREDTPAQSSTPAATPAPPATTTTPAPATPAAKTPATTVTEEQIDYNAPGDAKSPGYFVISKEDMTIKALDTKGRVIYSFPIAVGKAYGNKKVKGDMKTPEGEFTIQEILPASAWTHDFKDGRGEIKGAYGP